MLARVAVVVLLASATIAAVAPNPASDGDRGEFVVVSFDTPTNTTGWTLTDGDTTVALPNRTLDGTVALSTEPAAARNRTEHRLALNIMKRSEAIALGQRWRGRETKQNTDPEKDQHA